MSGCDLYFALGVLLVGLVVLFFWAARYLIFCFRFSSRTGGESLNFLLILIFHSDIYPAAR